jgi:hypothetical protein
MAAQRFYRVAVVSLVDYTMQLDRMSRGRFVLVGLLGTLGTLWAASCQGPQEFFRDSGVVNLGSGGIVSTGGQGASTSTGGVTGTGGTVVVGTGGTGTGGVATGGVTGTGGVATGGITGTGGKATGGVTGTGGVATGGITGTGGKATGGITGTGGVATGGVTGTGGLATGGITGTGGTATGGAGGAAGSTGTAKNCADAIALAGYSATGAQPCSACKENGADKSVACKAVIDCLDTKYPCGSANNCALQCNNSGGADSVVSVCVNALLTAGSCVQP